MPNENDSDDSQVELLCAPPKKSKGLTALPNSSEPAFCSTQQSSASMTRVRLSLSQRKRQFSTPAKCEEISEDEDEDIIPASQKYLKPSKPSSSGFQYANKKAKLDLHLEDDDPELIFPKSPQIYDDILLSPNPGNQSSSSTLKVNTLKSNRASFILDDAVGLSPSGVGESLMRVQESTKQRNEHLDENSNKTSQSTILSFDMNPKAKPSSTTAYSCMSGDERASRLLKTSFSASGASKEDFIRHWVDSCPLEPEIGPMETQDLIDVPSISQRQDDSALSSCSETQPLFIRPADCLELEMSSGDKAPADKRTTPPPPLMAIDEEPVPSTSGVVSTCTASLITPPKKNAQNGKTSTGSSKQTTLTDFFTPHGKTPVKTVPKTDLSQVQMRTCINELTQQDDEGEYSQALSIQTVSVKSNSGEAKAQWSEIMSKMRGSAKNLKREMKQSNKGRAAASNADESSVSTKADVPEANQRRCPFYKRIPGTSFAIDAFNYGRIPGVTCYFLSHFHYDHYQGLGKWIDKPVYCSKVTANLIQLKIKLPSHLVRVIPLNESRVIENIEVVLIDANHCPGAVMFLFRFPTGRCVLHVGDFRAHPSMANVRELTRSPISELYLDTTYCDPNYDLPAQEEVIAYVRSLVRRYVQRHPKLLVVSGTYTIGKEKVFMAAAEELDCKIWAPAGKRAVLQCIEEPDISRRIVSNPTHERVGVHVVNMGDISPRNLKSYLDTLNGRFTHILALNPTGWEYDGKTAMKGLDGIQPKVFQGAIFVYGVPYSEHSGFTEMKQFVQRFRPGKIVPTVNVGSAQQRAKMEATFDEWLGRRSRPSKNS